MSGAGPTLAQQKVALLRAIQVLHETGPERVRQEAVTGEGLKLHLQWLEATLETIDGLDQGRDMRRNLITGAQVLR